MLARFGMTKCNPISVPADPHSRLSKLMSPTTREETEAMKNIPYREAVGCLMYLANTTRPDISFAVGQVARFCSNPGKAHWAAVTRILAYLAGTWDYCLRLGGRETSTEVSGYVDADLAGDIDSHRSTSGCVIQLNGGAVSWSSRRQDDIALSTAESEYVSLNEAAKEAVWVERFVGEITKEEESALLKCDNQSAIKVAANPEKHQKMKHVKKKHHWVRERMEEGEIKVEHVAGEDNVADLFTKPLPGPRFHRLRSLLGVIPPQ